MWFIGTCDEWDLKRFQTRPAECRSFYAPWIAVIDLPQPLCCGFIFSSIDKKTYLKIKAIICVSQLSHRPDPNNEVPRSCTRPYGDANDVFVVPNSVYHLLRLQSFQYENISITISQVSMYDILVSWILCRMYLYAHKSWSILWINKYLIRSFDCDVIGPLWRHQKLSNAQARIIIIHQTVKW